MNTAVVTGRGGSAPGASTGANAVAGTPLEERARRSVVIAVDYSA